MKHNNRSRIELEGRNEPKTSAELTVCTLAWRKRSCRSAGGRTTKYREKAEVIRGTSLQSSEAGQVRES